LSWRRTAQGKEPDRQWRAGVGFYGCAMKRDWLAIIVLVTEILILLVAGAGVYAAIHYY
jgi:hypothetical protein